MYAVIRLEKRKGAAISAIEKHNSRMVEKFEDGTEKRWAENADPELTKKNIVYKKYPSLNLSQSINKHLKETGIEKTRKDAVKAVEILCTASPEFFHQKDMDLRIEAFRRKANAFIIEKYGKENVITADLHLDEKTPHIHYVIVPLTKDKRLSAKIVCGNRKDYQNLQNEYAEKMKSLGLKRGIEGSNVKHIKMKEFYGALNTDSSPINDFLEKRKNRNDIKLKKDLGTYKAVANAAYALLHNLNYTLDIKTLKPRSLTKEEIEILKKKRRRDQGFKL